MGGRRVDVLLFGLGAIGSFYAFILGKNKNVSLSVVARSNYEAVKRNGLRIESETHGNHDVRIDHVYRHPADAGRKFDYIVCAHKAVNPTAVPPLFKDVADKNTTFTIMQNGVGNEEPFRDYYPDCTIISCVVWVGATQYKPGVVSHSKSEMTEMGLFANANGNPSKEQSRLDTFAKLLVEGGTNISVEKNIQLKRWEKVVWNCAWNPLTALTLLDTHAWLDSSVESTAMTRLLMQDVIAVAQRCGVPLQDDLVDILMARIRALAPLYSSMYADVQHNRPLEIDVIIGHPMKKAREFGMDVPTLSAVYSMIAAVDLRLRQSRL